MKKRVISMLMAAMLLLVCAGPAWADTDKEIQFTGHTFGETFSEAAQIVWINTVEFEKKPKTTRAIADPVYARAYFGMYNDSPVGYCFFSRVDGQKVAGHNAGIVLRFYFPTEEAAVTRDVDHALFYGGAYEFYDENKKATFDDLKQKLTSLYGSPSAEFTNPAEFWGKPAHRKSMSDEEAEQHYQNDLNNFSDLSCVVWRQSGTDRQLVLVYYRTQDGWEETSLSYLDASADALIEQMYNDNDAEKSSSFGDSLEGL